MKYYLKATNIRNPLLSIFLTTCGPILPLKEISDRSTSSCVLKFLFVTECSLFVIKSVLTAAFCLLIDNYVKDGGPGAV